jgi:hypothetical protein
LTKDLVALHYKGFSEDSDDVVQALVLIYKDFQAAYILEQTLPTSSVAKKEQQDAFEHLMTVICQVQLALLEGRHFRDVPKRHYMQYCQVVNEGELMRKKDVFTGLSGTIASEKKAPS